MAKNPTARKEKSKPSTETITLEITVRAGAYLPSELMLGTLSCLEKIGHSDAELLGVLSNLTEIYTEAVSQFNSIMAEADQHTKH